MIEGLILAGELLVFGLLLWNARQLDGKRARGLGLFDMPESDGIKAGANKRKDPYA